VVTARNAALERLEPLLGRWLLTLSGAWFLDSLETEIHGSATIEWLGDAFVVMNAELDGDPTWDLVLGHSDPENVYRALYHDARGTARVFAMSFTPSEWTLHREDPDFHQRFVARVEADRVVGHWDASDDRGETWRKDFDLVFARAPRV
jgi:hypothetical protein